MHPDSTGTPPLHGIKVVDLSTVIAGPFATSFLAEHGAEIIKIEPPAGDILRQAGQGAVPGMGPIFQHVNQGKRSVVLDLKNPTDREQLLRLVADADALVFNMRPDAMKRLGLSYEEVLQASPGIIYFSLTGFGSGGRYAGLPAYDDIIQGMTGIPDLMARAAGDDFPRYVPMAMADRITGLYASIALLIALVGRRQGRQPIAIEVPMFETMAHFNLVEHMFLRSFEPPLGSAVSPRMVDSERRPYRTADGYICVLPYTTRNWDDLFLIAGRPELCGDDRFCDLGKRMSNSRFLNNFLRELMPTRSNADWLAQFEKAAIPAMPVNSIEELLSNEHLEDVGFFRQGKAAGGRRFIAMRSPITWNTAPWPVDQAPGLGEHSQQYLET